MFRRRVASAFTPYREFVQSSGVRLVLLVFSTATACGEGFRNPPPGTAGMGRSGVWIAQADDPSAVSYNPANLLLLDRPAVEAAVSLARTRTEYEGPAGAGATSKDPWQALPNLYAVWPAAKAGASFGLGLTTPFGQSVEWDRDSVLSATSPYFAEMGLVNVNPAAAARLGDRLLVGIGLDVYASTLEFRSTLDNGPVPGEGSLDLEGDGAGVGGNLGITWQITERQRMAVTWRSAVEVEYDGDARLGNTALPLPGRQDFSTEIEFPSMAAAGYGIELSDSLRLEVDIEWIEFSVNDVLRLDTGLYRDLVPPETPQDWKNTWTAGIGGDWRFLPNWILRAGYTFLESPVPDDTFAPTLPDADRHAVACGLGYKAGSHNLGLTYVASVYANREIRNSAVPPHNGDYDLTAHLVGVSYGYLF